MNFILRTLRLLTIVAWVGGLIFFAFVEAPTAFHVMGTTRTFAQLINGSITTLNRLGHAAGLIFVIATILLSLRSTTRLRRLLVAQFFLVVLMIAATIYVQHGIIPAMERDRTAAGGGITAVPINNPVRVDFDRLHGLSEKFEGAALLLGLGVILLMAAEPPGEWHASR
jgi:putative copper export protein